MCGVTITKSEWSPKFLYNLDTSEEFLHCCNPELAILSSLKLLHSISCSFDGDLFLSRVQYQFLQVDRILLVQGFGNGASTKTIVGKPFGRRVKWWLSLLNLSDARYINAKLSNRMCDKTSPVLEKIRFLISN